MARIPTIPAQESLKDGNQDEEVLDSLKPLLLL